MSHLFIEPNNKEIIFELIEGEMVILNLSDGNYYTLDGIGKIIWDLIIQRGQVERIITEVHKIFKERQDRESLQKVIQAFIDALSDAGLVVCKELATEDQLNSDIIFDETYILPDSEAFSKPVLHSYKALQDKFKHPAGIKRSDE